MVAVVGGNKLFGAVVTYSTAPSSTAENLKILDASLSDFATTSGRITGQQPLDVENYTTYATLWSGLSNPTTITITYNIGVARGADEFVLRGMWGATNYTRPTAVRLEYSDNGSDWTTVDNITGMTAGTTGTLKGWLAYFDTSAAGDHQYWRTSCTVTSSAFAVTSAMLGTFERSVLGVVSPDSAANASFPLYSVDKVQSGDSDWAVNYSNMLSFGSTAQAANNQTVGYAGWDEVDDTVVYTLDNQTAVAADTLDVYGYFGTNSIGRPNAYTVEYSDNGSDWTTHASDTGLTNGGTTTKAHWWLSVPVTGQVHRYWRLTLVMTYTSWIFVANIQLLSNGPGTQLSPGKAYTTSGTLDGQFPNDYGASRITPTDGDWVNLGGKLTRRASGPPLFFNTGIGWNFGAGASQSAYVDLESATKVDQIVIIGIQGTTSMLPPAQIVLAYSDNAADWTDVFTKSSLTQSTTLGDWAVLADVSAQAAHRYWRATVTNGGTASRFIVFTQIQLWQGVESTPSSDPFSDDFTGTDDDPWDETKWDQDGGPGGGSTTIQGNRGQAAGAAGQNNSGGRGKGKQGNVPNQEMTGTFQLCETGEPCRGALWLQTSNDWEDLDNPTEGYGIYLPSDSDTASLVVANAGVVTTLDTATWPRDTGLKQYRFRRQSNKVRFRIWDDGDPEPSGWTLTGDDSSITPGDAGAFQVAYTCPTAPSVDACALFDAIDVDENNTPIPNGNGGNGGRGCCNGRNRRCCRRNRATQ